MAGLHVGLIVNPIAGIGGAAGLKGSDDGWRQALDRGFEPPAPARAARFAAGLGDLVQWTTGPGALGVPGLPTGPGAAKALGETTSDDTKGAAQEMRDAGVDLICFVGGDGTATDIADAVGDSVPCLGVPAGVKVTSAVFAHDVDSAAFLVAHLSPLFETVARDVTDLDEETYRAGHIETRLTGSLRVPLSPFVQGGKSATPEDTPLEPLVEQVLGDWDDDAIWLVGAGSVCKAIKAHFRGASSLLGVDVVRDRQIVLADGDGPALEDLAKDAAAKGRPLRILLSPIGGQGMLLGRGTQVLTPRVLRAAGWGGLRVVAPPEKLRGLPGLWVDSGDPAWDAAAPGHVRVVTGWNETRMVRVLHGAGGEGEISSPS